MTRSGDETLTAIAELIRAEHARCHTGGSRGGGVVALPGMWGAAALRDHLLVEDAILVQPFTSADGSTELVVHVESEGRWSPVSDALDPLPLITRPVPPLILVERADTLDAAQAARLSRIAGEGRGFLVILTPSRSGLPESFRQLTASGVLCVEEIRPVDTTRVRLLMREHLRGEPSAVAVSRLSEVSGGHQGLLPSVTAAAVRAGALIRDDDEWVWDPHRESAFEDALRASSDALLAGFGPAHRRALHVAALGGSLPERSARRLLGGDVVASLRQQGLLRADRFTAGGHRSLSLRVGALRVVFSESRHPGEGVRLWHDFGREMSEGDGGAAAEVGLAAWRVRTEGALPAEETARLARLALGVGRFDDARTLLDAIPGDDDADLWVLRARVDAVCGDVSRALARVHERIARVTRGDTPSIADAAHLLARLAVFRPDARAALRRLNESSRAAGAAVVDGSVFLTALVSTEDEIDPVALRSGTLSTDPAEEMAARLWRGAHLAFRGEPHAGREVLLALLDDAHREPGYRECQDQTAALLLILHEQFGWRPVSDAPPLWSREYDVIGSARLAPLHDLMRASVVARTGILERARRGLRRAAVAVSERDPFGLRPFADALARATGNPGDTSGRDRPGGHHGFWALSSITEGLRVIADAGFGPEAVPGLLRLAAEAGDDGFPAQRAELLFMALVAGSEAAAQQVLAGPGPSRTTRTAVTEDVARALVSTGDHAEALAVVRRLRGHGADLLAVRLLGQLWPRLAADSPVRRGAASLALALAREVGREPWAADSFLRDVTPSTREREVLRGLSHGEPTRVIATRMRLSPRTVEGIISRMLRRYGCANRVELLALAPV
ncbi:LuxR C-terminal-related transcriptional regulator [Streptomyces sp. MS2A]|nr:LuxR C-terminal-related transcriptional regulator [Streptomyces sp. MS2A]